MENKGLYLDKRQDMSLGKSTAIHDFVLDRDIFSVIFDKDIRRVYIYKKVERLAKVLHMIRPAFLYSTAIRNKIDEIAVSMIETASLPPTISRHSLSRGLLALSSILGAAREGGALSQMNAGIIIREIHALLQEICEYEEPNVTLMRTPTLANLGKTVSMRPSSRNATKATNLHDDSASFTKRTHKGHIKDEIEARSSTIISILKNKNPAYIKDISMLMRDVSEKTIQRDLRTLVESGKVVAQGEKRWTTYMLHAKEM